MLAPVLLLAWIYRGLGALGLLLGTVLLAAVGFVGWRLRRTVVRRRSGTYTSAELARLDEQGLGVAVERILSRDGWHVISMPYRGRPRLYARDRGGRQLDVGFRPADKAPADEDAPTVVAPLREAGRPGVDNLIRVVVSTGSYSRTDVLWASRQGGVRLVDGRQLQQWAAGTPLDDLVLPG
ncbi:hypothetical protein ACFWJ5_38475 [Streptomyces qaidamensis]|uniref:hypothetical protein n=1 Tax=Streptomyces qaidamensis TaxID=1783515 RepID=UPI003657D262